MANRILLRNEATGLSKNGFIGFSWTTLFFSFWPPLFRGDLVTFAILLFVQLALGFFTFGIGALVAGIAWAFIYNGYYTRRLIEKGYRITGSGSNDIRAREKFGIPEPVLSKTEPASSRAVQIT